MSKLRIMLTGLLLAAVMALAPAAPASAHADSPQAAAVCNASIPTGFGSAPGDVVIHANLAGVGFGWSYYSCESWNFVTGSGSHGCQFHGWWINGVGPFGPETGWNCY
jgi:hypothetical protein